MDLLDVLPILRRRWMIVAATVGAALVLAALVIVVTPTTYTAQVELFVATASSSDAADQAQSNAYAAARVQSYANLVTALEVTAPVVKDLGLDLTPAQLATRIHAVAPLGRVVLDLTVTDGSAARVTAIANSVALHFADYIERLEAATVSATPVHLTVVHPAELPSAPTSPRVGLLIVLAILAGVVGGCVLAVARDVLDTKIRSEADLDPSGPPPLGAIPFDRQAGRQPIAVRDDPFGPRAEAFRQLRTTLDFLDVDHPPRVLAVTSPHGREGRTSTAVNLATSLADSGHRVCLVECDLRSPSLAGVLGLDPAVGLVGALVRREPVRDVLQSGGPNLAVLVAGGTPPNPNELLSSERFRSVISQLSAAADFVVMDTSPMLGASDAAEVAALADATLLVVRAGASRRPDVAHAAAAINLVGRSANGIVLTMVRPRDGEYLGYGSGYEPVAAATG